MTTIEREELMTRRETLMDDARRLGSLIDNLIEQQKDILDRLEYINARLKGAENETE